MRRIVEREKHERMPQEEGGNTWRDIAQKVEAEKQALEAKLLAVYEQERADATAIRTMAQDMLKKADDFLRLQTRHYQLQLEYRNFRLKVEQGVDVQAEVEPEEEGEGAQA